MSDHDAKMGEPGTAGSPIYLDHNATTPVLPEVFEAMRPWLTSEWGNPSSAHAYGRRAAAAVTRARQQVAELIGADEEEIIFTSCGSEADNLAVFGVSATMPEGGVILSSSMEHPAIEGALEHLVEAQPQWTWRRLETGDDGRVRFEPSQLVDVKLATVMLAHNETGAVQPVASLVEALRKASPGVVVHTDAAQAVGKIGVDVRELDVDLMTIVGHKFGAPKGVAALYRRRGTKLAPRILGGGQERGARAGTEAVAQLVALGEACLIASTRPANFAADIAKRRERLWSKLIAAIPDIHRTVADEPSLPNTLHVCVEGRDGRALLGSIPGLAASTGSACHAMLNDVPGVLGQMGLTADRARGALRLSVGFDTTDEQIDAAAALLIEACRTT